MLKLHLDFETRSHLDIKKVGLDRYARAAEVLMLAWAFDDGEPILWEAPFRGAAWNAFVEESLLDRNTIKVSWNSAFERAIFKHCLGLDVPVDQWLDPAVMARYATIPNSLADCSAYLQLGDKAKDKEGKRLITKFCKPGRGKFRAPEDHPEDWEKFKSYCLQDVVAEREVLKRLEKVFTLPPFEREVELIDAEINERGIPVDMQFVSEAKTLVDTEKARLKATLTQLTGVENPNSGAQMLPWLRERGYPYSSLLKKRVDQALLKEDLDPVVREALILRGKLSRSSTSKLDAIIDRVGPDNVLRNCYKFLGANRTGRWAGTGFNLQNLPR